MAPTAVNWIGSSSSYLVLIHDMIASNMIAPDPFLWDHGKSLGVERVHRPPDTVHGEVIVPPPRSEFFSSGVYETPRGGKTPKSSGFDSKSDKINPTLILITSIAFGIPRQNVFIDNVWVNRPIYQLIDILSRGPCSGRSAGYTPTWPHFLHRGRLEKKHSIVPIVCISYIITCFLPPQVSRVRGPSLSPPLPERSVRSKSLRE